MLECKKLRIFKKALKLNVVQKNPTEYAVLPKKKDTVEDIENKTHTIKYLEKDELAYFLNLTKEQGLDFDYIIFSLLAFSGMRSGELLALKWTDIDFKANTISITKTLFNLNNNQNYQLLTPKTKGSIRVIRMDPNVMLLLNKYKLEQSKFKFKMGCSYTDENFIFTNTNGTPLNGKFILNRMNRLMNLAKFDKLLSPHSLRHTHTSLLIEAGVGIKEIQQRLGHSDINTTMNIYTHMTKNMEEKASQKFSELMKGLIN